LGASVRPVLFLTTVLVAGTSSRGSAQSFCVWPHSLPRCNSWFITEPGVLARLTDRQPDDETVLFTVSAGWMKNTSRHWALGGELFFGAEGEMRGGAAVRTRWWISENLAADASVGAHLAGEASGQQVRAGSPRVSARLALNDVLAAVARFDYLLLECKGHCDPQFTVAPNQNSPRFYLGGETGSLPGLVVTALAGVAVLVVIADYGF